MTGPEILRITDPFELFNPVHAREQYHDLIQEFHPDHGGAQDVFLHIRKLYDIVKSLPYIDIGTPAHSQPITIGTMIWNNNSIHYVYDGNKNVPKGIDNPKFFFPSDHIKVNIEPLLAKSPLSHDFVKGTPSCVSFTKAENWYPLSAVIGVGPIPPEHVAWIMSRLYYLCTFFEFNHIIHLGLTSDNILICPTTHQATVIGGWWYAIKDSETVQAMPESIYRYVSSSMTDKHISHRAMNAEIHALGREMLGNRAADYAGLRHCNDKMAQWVCGPICDSVREEYKTWDTEGIPFIFGTRKFAKWENIDEKMSHKNKEA